MADGSAIEWTEATWNPVTGCTKVSPGCAHCYAETFAERWRGTPGHPYEQGFDLKLWPSRLEQPLRWTRPRMIFVNSMSDLFHEDIPFEFIASVFDVMVRVERHTFQILTKRQDRLADLAPDLPWPRNVWMGVSIENRRFVHRADRLREVPAAVRFISAEPLLGPLEHLNLDGIHWLIAGLDDMIIALYAGGMTVRDISDHLSDLYGIQVQRDTVSRVTDAVLEDVQAWRTRPLDRVYPIVYFDALFVKVREDRSVRARACYLALGVTCDGDREVLGIWWQDTEGAKFWLAVLERPTAPRRRRRPHFVRGRAEGLPRSDRGDIPAGVGADLHRSPDPQQPALRQLPRPAQGRRRPEADLHRGERRGRPGRARPLRSRMGRPLPAHGHGLEGVLGTRHPVPRAPRRPTPRGLHHEHDRGTAPPDPQSDQDPRALPRRTGRHQADLPRRHQGRRQVAAQPLLDERTRRPQDHFGDRFPG